MFRRIARCSVVAAVAIVGATAGSQSVASAHGVAIVPGVHRDLHRSTNVEQAYKVDHCIVHFEFGTFGGAAYSFVRVTNEDPGYACTYTTQVVGVRDGDELINGPQSGSDCAARTPKGCNRNADYYRWARSTLPSATVYAANVQVWAVRRWPPPTLTSVSYATISPG